MTDQVIKAFEQLNINDYSIHQHDKVLNMEEMTTVLNNIDNNIIKNNYLAKNLFMKDKKKNYFLIVTNNDRKLDLKKVAKQIGAKGNALRFADNDKLQELLQVEKGAATPLAVINDGDNKVKVILDQLFFNDDQKYVIIHPLINTASTLIKAEHLKTYIESNGNDLMIIDFDAELSDPKVNDNKVVEANKKKKKKKKM